MVALYPSGVTWQTMAPLALPVLWFLFWISISFLVVHQSNTMPDMVFFPWLLWWGYSLVIILQCGFEIAEGY